MPTTASDTPTEQITNITHTKDFTTPWEDVANEDGSVSKVRLTQTTYVGRPPALVIHSKAPIGASWTFGHSRVPAGHSIVDPPETCTKGYRVPGKEVEYLWEVKPSSKDRSTLATQDKTVTHSVNHWFTGTECETRTIERGPWPSQSKEEEEEENEENTYVVVESTIPPAEQSGQESQSESGLSRFVQGVKKTLSGVFPIRQKE